MKSENHEGNFRKALGLDLQSEDIPNVVLEKVNDDEECASQNKGDIQDIRTKHIGQLIAQLPKGCGSENAGLFEEWALRAVKLLFHKKLVNPDLHPNGNAVSRRDVVATNMADSGFWRRIREDYGSRQVIFEVKNYVEMKLDDYRQVLSYCTGDYGKFAVFVNKAETEGVSEHERNWIKEIYDNHKILVFSISANTIARCISKLRKADRFDYAEDILAKRLDTYVRSYLSLKSR